jgi:steroid delta-isomerase-like uncharacterized protein
MDESLINTAKALSYAIQEGDWDAADSLLAEDFRYSASGQPSIGKREYLHFMRNSLCSAMTDMEMEFTDSIEKFGLVTLDYANTMTHSGNFLGYPGSGRRVIVKGRITRHVKNGRIYSEWHVQDRDALIEQMAGPAINRPGIPV